jgi:hypothetical protein
MMPLALRVLAGDLIIGRLFQDHSSYRARAARVPLARMEPHALTKGSQTIFGASRSEQGVPQRHVMSGRLRHRRELTQCDARLSWSTAAKQPSRASTQHVTARHSRDDLALRARRTVSSFGHVPNSCKGRAESQNFRIL